MCLAKKMDGLDDICKRDKWGSQGIPNDESILPRILDLVYKARTKHIS